ncbi:hypothetical protein BDY21DRAFT_281917 [Lineolata rhizophorae]|uniref:AAA+ ATPase domain-containing protein n=1 Tax=Lineolata rhizophorae TaxID=578093 RepID=A0A6A6P5Q9_9PEZI|nr:hypothetical protein BDY21DRAFT_281917 [Lineolata rhizophorae]
MNNPTDDSEASEFAGYIQLLNASLRGGTHGTAEQAAYAKLAEELKMAPLFSWSVKNYVTLMASAAGSHANPSHLITGDLAPWRVAAAPESSPDPVLLNTNTPWSAFICGSQGSGKSHTLSVMLEACLQSITPTVPPVSIARCPNPLAGIVFHYDTAHMSGQVCEAAYLCSVGIKVRVLVVRRVIREMAIANGRIDYADFVRKITYSSNLDVRQGSMLRTRLDLLESFMSHGSRSHKDDIVVTNRVWNEDDIFKGEPGTLTVMDLTDPFIDAHTACNLFDICLSIFMERNSNIGKVVALDEAHMYVKDPQDGEPSPLSANLLRLIRQQRHLATRIIIATQEPTISSSLLDLCSISIIHRFSSPAWFKRLQGHLAGMLFVDNDSDEEANEKGGKPNSLRDNEAMALFNEIVSMNLGESLLISPGSFLHVDANGSVPKLNSKRVRFTTRVRASADGGRSKLAVQ